MISVVMATRDDEAHLVRALSPLVAASMDGLVRELVIADQGSTDATLAIAEDAGAVLVEGGLAEAARAAKGPWLLILEPSARLDTIWAIAARDHIERFPQQAARLTGRGLFARTEALLAPKRLYEAGKAGRGRRISCRG